MRFLVVFSAFLIMSVFGAAPVNAQGHSAFCGQADSTAASQGCLKRHLDNAQSRLNKVYKKLTRELEGESLESLKELQNTWLRYRDAECMWEADRSATASLKRINELSCMARITDDRVDLLTIALSDNSDEGVQREYGSFPRWMNVVAKDNPDIFWNYGKRTSSDLDCDGDEEFIMQGLTMKSVKSTSDEEDTEDNPAVNFEQNIVFAIAQNPSTGRPTAQIFNFPVRTQESTESLCSSDVSIDFGEHPEPEKVENESEEVVEPACRTYVKINDRGCEPKIISWGGKNFALEIEETPDNE